MGNVKFWNGEIGFWLSVPSPNEGNAINLSLTALGGCIKALSEGKKPNFRDSKLTLLLMASMTSGKVIMIAALSPASICYAETLSTLTIDKWLK